jgi:hypothetical protein
MVAGRDDSVVRFDDRWAHQPDSIQREQTMNLGIDIDIDTEAATPFERTEEEQLVHEWRTEQLEILGLSRVVAEVFASRVDWHKVAELVKRGCSADLALEILR